MGYNTTEHRKAIIKMVKEKRLVLQMDLATVMNKANIKYSVEKLIDEGKFKRQKVKNRGTVGNLSDVWLLYSNDVKQAEILEFEKLLINKPFNSPLKNNHCYKKPEKPIEQKLKGNVSDSKDLEIKGSTGLTIVTNEVIPIYNNNNERMVNARELYNFLQSKRQFADWIKLRISKYDFIENEDYFSLSQKCEGNNATKIEYYLTINTAKEMAMVENNERGKHIRRYFIQVENEYKQQNNIKPTSDITALKMIVAELENQNNRITNIENKLMSLAN